MATAAADLTLDIKRIKADPNNIRTKVSVKPIEGLADSIAESGLLQPVIVRPVDDHYMLIAGHRRYAAIGQLVDEGRHDGQVDVIIRNGDITEADVTVMQLVENLQREDIVVLDEAAGYMRLLEFDMTQADIARKVGRGRSHITKRLSLLALPEVARKALTKGDITIEHALNIAALDPESMEEFCQGDLHNTHSLLRKQREQKGKKVAEKFAAELKTAGGVEVFTDRSIEDVEHPEDQHYETVEVHYQSDYKGTIDAETQVIVVRPAGEDAMATLYKLVENTAARTADKEEKREDAEKIKRREERLAKQAEEAFLAKQLIRVKAGDATDFAVAFVLGNLGESNSAEICRLLDLEVEVREETTYEGKIRNVRQTWKACHDFITEARENGDIGNLRRMVLAICCTYGYRSQLLDHFGFDPTAQAEDDTAG